MPPELESLDLRKCFHVTLSGYLGNPDSTDNYEFVADDGSFEEVSDIVYSLDDIHDDGSFDDDDDGSSFDDDDDDSDYDPSNSY